MYIYHTAVKTEDFLANVLYSLFAIDILTITLYNSCVLKKKTTNRILI